MKIQVFILLTITILVFSCRKEEGVVTEKNSAPELTGGVIVLNEGLWQANNASLTYRNEQGEVNQDVFQSINGRALGDVLQSASDINGELYLVLNNSQKVEVVHPGSLSSIRTIEGFPSPRYVVEAVDGQKAWVSNFKLDQGVNEIDVVDLKSGEISIRLNVNGWCEQLIKVGDKIMIANTGMDQVIITDGTSITEVSTPPQPIDLVLDAQGKVWILCTGGFQDNMAALCRFDPLIGAITDIFRFSNPFAFPSNLSISEKGDRLYFLESGLYSMSIDDTAIPEKALVEQSGAFYGLGIQPGSGHIYIGDAVDYASKGRVLIYSPQGEFIDSFDAGYLPRGFVFR